VEHARAGDAHAIAAVTDCGHWLGVGLATVVNLLAPPAIVLGGDFAALAQWLAPAIEQELRPRVLGSTATWPSLAISHVGPDAAARGGAVTAARRLGQSASTGLGPPGCGRLEDRGEPWLRFGARS
jgi:predicted NBD/HSP70 family sugar kinase